MAFAMRLPETICPKHLARRDMVGLAGRGKTLSAISPKSFRTVAGRKFIAKGPLGFPGNGPTALRGLVFPQPARERMIRVEAGKKCHLHIMY